MCLRDIQGPPVACFRSSPYIVTHVQRDLEAGQRAGKFVGDQLKDLRRELQAEREQLSEAQKMVQWCADLLHAAQAGAEAGAPSVTAVL